MAVIGVGIDLVEIERAERMLTDKGARALDRLLTAGERAYVESRLGRPAQHLAVRVAAKEAVWKALQALPGAKAIGWRDIEVTHTGERRPLIVLHGTAVTVTESVRGFTIHLSLSHSALTAGAMAVVEGDRGEVGARDR